MIFRCNVLSLIFFALLCPYACLGEEGLPDAQTVIESYEEGMKLRGAYSFHFRDQHGQFGDVNYDGQNCRVIQNIQRGANESNYAYNEGVLLNGKYLRFEINPEQQPDDPVVLSAFNPTKSDLFLSQLFFYNYLVGFFPNANFLSEESLTDILGQTKLTVSQDDTGCIVLQGQKDNYKIEAVFLPKRNYALKRFLMSRDKNSFSNLTLDNRLDIVDFLVVFDDFHEINSVSLPRRAKSEGRFVGARWEKRGQEHIEVPYISDEVDRKEVTVTDYVLNRKFSETDFSLTKKVPNLATVHMQDAPQIQYVWFDGKTEPLTDELALARLRGHKFIPGVREPRFWFIASGIILISLALAGQLWKYFQNKKKKEDKFLS